MDGHVPEGEVAQRAPQSHGGDVLTPTRLQSVSNLNSRRLAVAALNIATYLLFLRAVGGVLGSGGFGVLEGLMLALLAVGLPWTVLGFWNSVIGLWLLHGRSDGLKVAAPFAAAGSGSGPITVTTAVLMTLRNEDPARALSRLRIIKASLDATGVGETFSYFVLSDTNRPEVASAEEALIASWQAQSGASAARIIYRRRSVNTGFKAGNVREFCVTHGANFDLMLPLDADSLMTGETILQLVRICQAHPKIGILQSLVVGLPSQSAFARMFQFGMRHGMRCYTFGMAYWTAECGPFWGHNAMIRVKPFTERCELPILPGRPPLGGHVLSHDQVEATFMRRAGFEVRVLPIESGSYEDNPPTILDYMRRDLRWCQGNLQYFQLVGTPGLFLMSRYQLAWAILMFLGLPAFTILIALAPVLAWAKSGVTEFPSAWAATLYVTYLLMYLSPKIAGLVDTALTPGGVKAYGGPVLFGLSSIVEIVASFLQGAVTALATSLFMGGLLVGHQVTWSGQDRDARGLSWGAAWDALWPQTAFGAGVMGLLWLASPTMLWWSLPLTAGYVLAVPFAVISAWPELGRWMQRKGLCAIPEDFAPPAEVQALAAAKV